MKNKFKKQERRNFIVCVYCGTGRNNKEWGHQMKFGALPHYALPD
jgi:hypothetical protein